MKKLIREDGIVLIISVVIMYLAFRTASGWEWHFLAAALFALVAGVAGGVLTQVVSMIIASKRGAGHSPDGAARSPDGGSTGERHFRDRADAQDDDYSASGTGAEESGPRGPVHRSEEYRSSLEDPD